MGVIRLLTSRDLVERGYVTNDMDRKRKTDNEDFPPGFMWGPNSRRWREHEVVEWVERRIEKCVEAPGKKNQMRRLNKLRHGKAA